MQPIESVKTKKERRFGQREAETDERALHTQRLIVQAVVPFFSRSFLCVCFRGESRRFHMAARAGQANVVKFLVANGADVDAKSQG